MKAGIAAIGRLKKGPERELYERYVKRAEASGRQIGIGPFSLIELNESKVGNVQVRQQQEGQALLSKIQDQAILVVLDEKGKSLTSRTFSDKLIEYRDLGRDSIYFIIGGPDGLSSDIKNKADLSISFGAMTMPHGIVRILLAEQLYRAITIASGHPYHRD